MSPPPPILNNTFLKIITIVSYIGAGAFYIKGSLLSLIPSILLIPVSIILVVTGKPTSGYYSLGLVFVNQLIFMFSETFIQKS
jgi:hypothetical protein